LKIQRKVSATTIIEVDGETPADLFERLAQLESVFHGHETCGLCKKTGVSYQVQRDKENNRYFKAVCDACGAEFRFGVKREGAGILFPQLKDKDGAVKPNGGWSKWEPNQGDGYQAPKSNARQPAGSYAGREEDQNQPF
jgi:hypothetical protein